MAGVAGALFDELKTTGSVITVNEPRAGVRFTLSDDLRGSPDFFLSKGGPGSLLAAAAAAREWTCDSDKFRDKGTLVFCCTGVSLPESAFAGVGADCSGGRMAGKRKPRTRRGRADCEADASDEGKTRGLASALMVSSGAGG